MVTRRGLRSPDIRHLLSIGINALVCIVLLTSYDGNTISFRFRLVVRARALVRPLASGFSIEHGA